MDGRNPWDGGSPAAVPHRGGAGGRPAAAAWAYGTAARLHPDRPGMRGGRGVSSVLFVPALGSVQRGGRARALVWRGLLRFSGAVLLCVDRVVPAAGDDGQRGGAGGDTLAADSSAAAGQGSIDRNLCRCDAGAGGNTGVHSRGCYFCAASGGAGGMPDAGGQRVFTAARSAGSHQYAGCADRRRHPVLPDACDLSSCGLRNDARV